MQVSFPPGRYIEGVVKNWANYQSYQYDFFQCHIFVVKYFMNGEGVCQIIQGLFLNHSF